MLRGTTAVVTVLRKEDRDVDHMEDQQLHVLPLYVPDCSQDELDKHVADRGLIEAILEKTLMSPNVWKLLEIQTLVVWPLPFLMVQF